MNIKTKHFSKSFLALVALGLSLFFITLWITSVPKVVSAQSAQEQAQRAQQQAQQAQDRAQQQEGPDNLLGEAGGGHPCGKGDNVVKTRINFGCLGPNAPTNMSPIEDMLYAFIRFLSVGVGIVIIGSIIYAGIQYSTSEGNPEATQASKDRVRNAIIGLFIYLFAFALVQYLVPGGAFR